MPFKIYISRFHRHRLFKTLSFVFSSALFHLSFHMSSFWYCLLLLKYSKILIKFLIFLDSLFLFNSNFNCIFSNFFVFFHIIAASSKTNRNFFSISLISIQIFLTPVQAIISALIKYHLLQHLLINLVVQDFLWLKLCHNPNF